MTIHQFKNIIEEGDLVILYFSPVSYHTLVIESGKDFHNKYGSYKLSEFIGKEYGSKIASHKGKGFGYLLHPTPEWWSLVLNHRTQILYQPDISLISSFLNLKPGVKVIESGTGSGSFSHSIARAIAPTGHLYSFEYHEERSKIARQEFLDHGLSDYITVTHRDVCQNGFDMEDEVDAVFLDLPAPWSAIESAKKALKKNSLGRICCFSPCIEQVQRTCITLNEQGFNDISTYEVLTRNHELRTLPQPSVEEAIEFLKEKKLRAKAQSKRDYKGNTKKSDAEESQGNTTEADEDNKEATGPVKNLAPMIATSKPFATARGHTSYLTFAMLPPQLPVEDEDITKAEETNEVEEVQA